MLCHGVIMTKPTNQDDKAERLASALRANLRRRKTLKPQTPSKNSEDEKKDPQ
jgi:O-acetyl-ADP-ribose deacetylase (regulator of RNase III)